MRVSRSSGYFGLLGMFAMIKISLARAEKRFSVRECDTRHFEQEMTKNVRTKGADTPQLANGNQLSIFFRLVRQRQTVKPEMSIKSLSHVVEVVNLAIAWKFMAANDNATTNHKNAVSMVDVCAKLKLH